MNESGSYFGCSRLECVKEKLNGHMYRNDVKSGFHTQILKNDFEEKCQTTDHFTSREILISNSTLSGLQYSL